MLKWSLIVLGAIVALVVLVQVVGMTLPREHVAKSRARFAESPEVLFDAVADRASAPSWRPELEKVERLPDEDGKPVWREESDFGPMTARVDLALRPSRYQTTIVDEELPFGGSWTWEFAPVTGGTELTITEDGFVEPAIFRALSRFVFGYHATMDAYLVNLGAKFGEDVEPVHVEG